MLAKARGFGQKSSVGSSTYGHVGRGAFDDAHNTHISYYPMKRNQSRFSIIPVLAAAALFAGATMSFAQGGGGGGGRGAGLGGLPNATPEQTTAVADLTTKSAAANAEIAAARTNMLHVLYAATKPDAAKIKAAVDAVAAAEVKLATVRADWFAALQGGASKLAADQIEALVGQQAGGARAGRGGAGAGGGGGGGGRGAGQ